MTARRRAGGRPPDKDEGEAEPLDPREAAREIWLAGLGALAAAEEQGGKLFRTLVSRGAAYESRLGPPLERMRGRMREVVDEARARAGRTATRVETAFDERLRKALKRLGIPTQADVAKLAREIEQLAARIEGRRRRKTPGGKTPGA